MKNMAGNYDCDPVLEEELLAAGIDIVRLDTPQRGEVPARVTGKLGAITFWRAWYYWVATGPVPLHIAERLYEQQPYGRRDVRVAGHCGCPPPSEWAKRIAADGREIIVRNESLSNAVALAKDDPEGVWGRLMERLETAYIVVDSEEERDNLAVQVVVDTYHIDSLEGLKLFADHVRPTEA